jgi:hypothetical protein
MKCKHRHHEVEQPFDAIRVGTIIRWNGKMRTVRDASYCDCGFVQTVEFVKLCRSQYPSPLTIYFRTELRAAFGGIVAHRKLPLCANDVECTISADIIEGRSGNHVRVQQEQAVGVRW